MCVHSGVPEVEAMQIVTTHKNSDFDALASVVAASLLYPGIVPVVPKRINPNIRSFFSLHKDRFGIHHPDDIDLSAVTELVVVDANSWHRLEKMDCLKSRAHELHIEVWDHHVPEGDIPSDVSYSAVTGANITQMVEALQQRSVAIPPECATTFLMGLYEDTGHLTFTNTTPRDVRAAAYLLESGADLTVLSRYLRLTYGLRQKDILFEMLSAADRTQINGYTVSINCLELEQNVEGLAMVVRMFLDILNVDAAFAVFQVKNRASCTVIGRSAHEDIDVGQLMRALGGGGHPGAGSATIKTLSAPQICAQLEAFIGRGSMNGMSISHIMSCPVLTVLADAPMRDAAQLLRSRGCTGFPVVDSQDQLVGVISRRDFQKVKKEYQLDSPIKAFMSRSVITISPDKTPKQAADTMAKHDIGRLPVVENGRLIGIITRTNVMAYLYQTVTVRQQSAPEPAPAERSLQRPMVVEVG